MDKIVKEDDNFTCYETKSGIGYVASKNAFFHFQPERLNPEDASNSVCDSLSTMET